MKEQAQSSELTIGFDTKGGHIEANMSQLPEASSIYWGSWNMHVTVEQARAMVERYNKNRTKPRNCKKC